MTNKKKKIMKLLYILSVGQYATIKRLLLCGGKNQKYNIDGDI